jgi:hypothetical protein
MAERFDFDLSPKAYQDLVSKGNPTDTANYVGDAGLLLGLGIPNNGAPGANADGTIPHGVTIPASGSTPKRHRHKQIEIGDTIIMEWDFVLEPVANGLLAEIAASNAVFTWHFWDSFRPDRTLKAEANVTLKEGSQTVVVATIPGVTITQADADAAAGLPSSPVPIMGTDNLDAVRRGRHAFDVVWSGGASGTVKRTIAQGSWYSRGGDTA